MTLLLVFVGCVFTIYALWLTIAPFVGDAAAGVRLEHLDEEVRRIEWLVARRQMLLGALRELDFESETNKISSDDYEKFRRRYEREAVSILRELDEIHGGRDWQLRVDAELTERLGRPPRLSPVTQQDSAAEDEVSVSEAESDEGPPTNGSDQDELASVDAQADSEGADDDDRCASCSEPLAADDKFCSQCGAPTTMADEPAEQMSKSEASA